MKNLIFVLFVFFGHPAWANSALDVKVGDEIILKGLDQGYSLVVTSKVVGVNEQTKLLSFELTFNLQGNDTIITFDSPKSGYSSMFRGSENEEDCQNSLQPDETGKYEEIQIGSKTFKTCHVTKLEENVDGEVQPVEIWYADVPFGMIKYNWPNSNRASFADLQSYIKY